MSILFGNQGKPLKAAPPRCSVGRQQCSLAGRTAAAGEEPLGSLRTKLVNKVGGRGEEAVPVGDRGGGRDRGQGKHPVVPPIFMEHLLGGGNIEMNKTKLSVLVKPAFLVEEGAKVRKISKFSKQRDKNMHMLEGDKHFGDR